MTNNKIALEVRKARLTNILSQVDHYLSSCGESPDHIAKLYDNFISENHITRKVPEKLKEVLPPGYTSPPDAITADEASTSNPPSQVSVSQQHAQRNRKRKSAKSQNHQARSFFILKPTKPTPTTLSVHNLSSINFTQTELELLSKGLSFAPTPVIPYREAQLRLLSDYDHFAQNLRVIYEDTKARIYTTRRKNPT